MTRIRINDDFYIKNIADRPVAGHTATIIRKLMKHSEIVIAEVDGLAPYGQTRSSNRDAGHVVLAPGTYKALA